jgi:quinoprotein glucose dehydrogenase
MRHFVPSLSLLLAAATASASQAPIDAGNVARLTLAWTYDTGDSKEPLMHGADAPSFEATPVYAEGRLYLSSPMGTVAALDAETGREIWKVDLKIPRANYSDFANRGPTVHRGHVYVGTVDARLVCLESTTGKFCPKFGNNGQIDLTRGLRRPPERVGEYETTPAPAVYRDLVIVGSTVADNSRARMPSGEVRAFDAETGALRWTFHPLPADAQAGGANAWTRIVVDDANGLAFISTGSASPDYFGGMRVNADGHANSIVAVKAQTGEVVWHFQTVHHDLWDFDVASPATLYPARKAPAVAVGSKTGHVFLFNRLTGAPLFPIVERPVPASDVPGETAAATQPFPSKPTSLVPQRVTEADLWGRNAEELEACRRTFRSLRNEGPFTPPSVNGTLQVPGNIGGLHWGGLAWDATHRLLIAPVNRLPAVVHLIPSAQFREASAAFPQRETTEQQGTPFAMSREFFLSPTRVPCIAPPWGELVAINADTGDIAWHVTLGDLREKGLGAEMSVPTGSPNLGGPIVTDTGLVFIGATIDSRFRAFDARNGRELWSAKLSTGARATPLLYTTQKKRQMVAIAAGGHDNELSPPDSKLFVFALPE